jgi:hypothetical protein
MKRIDIKFFMETARFGIHRDESIARLVITYVATKNTLDTRKGILGMIKNGGGSALAITNLTRQIFRNVATVGIKTPHTHDDCVSRLCSKTHAISIDAAQNEVTSTTIMRRDVKIEENLLTPNLKIVSRDGAHGSGRFLKRGFGADEYLQRITTTAYHAKGSITQLVHHSTEFRQWFESAVQTSRAQGVVLHAFIKNLSAAKHRYQSFQKPSGRGCLFFDALVTVAERIFVTRKGSGRKESDHAGGFLEDVTEEYRLQWAMAADASDEVMIYTRYHDDPEIDHTEAGVR